MLAALKAVATAALKVVLLVPRLVVAMVGKKAAETVVESVCRTD